MTNAQLAEIVDTQKETLSIIQRRISQLADNLFIMQEDIERFKVAVGRDIEHLNNRTN